MNLKKILFLSIITSTIIVSYSGNTAFAADINASPETTIVNEVDLIEDSRGASTAYKYWAISSKSLAGSRNVGSENYITSYDTKNNGNSHSITHTESQKGSACIGISVANGAVGASIGYTPGTTAKVSVTTTSGRYKAGTTVKAYSTKREDIWSLYQKEYEVNHALGIVDRYTGNSKTGTAYKPAAPAIRFSPNANY